MERMVVVGETTSSSASYVSWEEVYVSSDKGRREVHYYLKRRDDESDLAVIGKEKSLRHMSYHYAFSFANGLINTNNRLKSRREVIDWLNSVVSGTYIYLFNWDFFCFFFYLCSGFLGLIDLKVFLNWVKTLVCKDPISSHGLFIRRFFIFGENFTVLFWLLFSLFYFLNLYKNTSEISREVWIFY